MGMSGGWPQSFAAPFVPTDFDVLVPGVLRFVVGFQLLPDGSTVTLQDGASVIASGQIVYRPPVTTTYTVDLDHVSALVVGLVTVDGESLKQISAADVGALETYFPLPTSPATPSATWTPLANAAATTAIGSLPESVRQAIRVHQRLYPIAPYGRK